MKTGKQFGHYGWLSHKDDEKMNSEHVIMTEIGNTTYIYIYMKQAPVGLMAPTQAARQWAE